MAGQLELNIAFTAGLIGMALAWRGGLQRYAGFYDSSAAVKYMLYGLVIGTIFAWVADVQIFREYLQFIDGQAPITPVPFVISILLSVSLSLLVMLLLTRKGVLSTRSAPTSGWGLGLGIGAMLAARFAYLSLDDQLHGLSLEGMLGVAIIVTMSPLLEAALCAGQGALSMQGRRRTGVLGASAGRFVYMMFLPAAVLTLMWWVFIMPFVMLLVRLAGREWLPLTLTHEARRRYRRLLSDNARRQRESQIAAVAEDE